MGRIQLADMFGADLGCREEAEEGSSGGGGLDGRSAVSFFALDDADDGGDDHAGFTCGFNGGDGGCAGGADVVDDDDAGTFFAEAFDAAAGAVRLLRFANEEAVEQGAAGVLLCAPGAGRRDVGDDGIGAHGESTDSFGVDSVLFQQFQNGVAGEASAFGVESGGSAIDVVVAGAAGGELELAELEAGAGEKREELLGVTNGGHRLDSIELYEWNEGYTSREVIEL
jgi:hypothetical protein